MKTKSILLMLSIVAFFILAACSNDEAISSSGVNKTSAVVKTDLNGNTVEQKNILERIKRDNLPGSIKHLYVISAYSGQVIFYSTVVGKVTSGNKRLNPSTVSGNSSSTSNGFVVNFPGATHTYYTQEVLGDDGTYGSSGEYIYWFDAKGVYHQHYGSGGQIIHVSDQPLAVKNIIINMELKNEK